MDRKNTSNEQSHYASKITTSPYLIPMVILSVVFLFFYRQDFLPQAILSGDFEIPYPYPPLVELSSAAPWYNIFSSFLYLNFYSIYGYIVNSLQVLLYIPAYVTMYIFLREINVRKLPAIILSMFYLLNPIVLPSVFSYNNLMWPEFYLFSPIFLFLILRYWKSRALTFLVILSALVSFYIEIQTAPLFFNIRLILPILALPFLFVLVKRLMIQGERMKTVLHFVIFVLLFAALNMYPLFSVAGIASKTTSLAAASTSGFQFFHYGNVVYTYQDQNLFFAISGLVVYPFYQNSFLMGYGQIFLPITAIFVAVVVLSVILSFIRRSECSGLRIMLSISAMGTWAFITLTQAGYTLPLFTRFPLLYLWEYPSYPESALIVIYVPMLSIFFVNNPRDISWVKTKKKFLSKLIPSVKIKRTGHIVSIMAPLIVGVLLFSYFAPVAATNSGGFSPIPDYETQSPLYHDIHSFFANKSGDYKVMIVPFNQTVYKELGSAIPDSNILALPYAYQNNPSAFANIADFHDLYSDVSSSQFTGFQLLLNNTGVEYLIVLKSSNAINNAVNLSSLSYLAPVSNTVNYVILKYTGYKCIEVESNPYVMNGHVKNQSITFDSELSLNSHFTNLSGYSQKNPYVPYWGEVSSNLPNYEAFNYTQGDASIRVQGNSSGARQVSELSQWVNVPGAVNLNLTAHILSQANSTSYLYIIPHSNGTTNASINPYQYLKRIPSNVYGNISMTVTVPGNTQFVDFGIMVQNITLINGSLNISYLDLRMSNVINPAEYENSTQGMLPFNAIKHPDANLSGYAYRSVLPLYPDNGRLNLSRGDWNNMAGTGFEVTQSKLSVKLPRGELLYLSIAPLAGTRVYINGNVFNTSFQDTIFGQSVNGIVNITTSGNAVFKYAVLVGNVNAQLEGNISVTNNNGKFNISNPNVVNVIVLIGSPLSSTDQISAKVSLLSVQTVNGVLEYLYVIMPGGSITYNLHESPIDFPMVIFNLTTFPIILSILIYGYYWLRKHRMH